MLMYEIWSLGHTPFEDKTNHEVRYKEIALVIVSCYVY